MLRVEDGEHTISEVITSVLISCQQKDLLTYGNLDFDLGELISYSCITNFLIKVYLIIIHFDVLCITIVFVLVQYLCYSGSKGV
jgi:hypothetical protein